MTKKTIEFDIQKEQAIGLFGSWNNSGLTSFGVIKLVNSCFPSNGKYEPPASNEVEVKIGEKY